MKIFFAGDGTGIKGKPHAETVVIKCGVKRRLYSYARQGFMGKAIAEWEKSEGMKIYFAGVLNKSREVRTTIEKEIERRLFSYHFPDSTITSIDEWQKSGVKLPEFFLDSGAFSAWTKGVEVDLEKYAQFVLDRPGLFSVVVNLDVIPGKWGNPGGQKEIDESAHRGWDNYYAFEKMLKPLNIKPLHIYHQGEDVKWLKRLMDEAEYFGISPGNDRTTKQKMQWLNDTVMPVLAPNGKPLRKFHGFGVTSLVVLKQYPWYSVDSTSWLMTSNFGSIFVPKEDIYKEYKVIFSEKSSSVNDEVGEGKHFRNLTPPEKKEVLRYLDTLNLTPEQLTEDYHARDLANISFFMELEKKIPPYDVKQWAPKMTQNTLGEEFK